MLLEGDRQLHHIANHRNFPICLKCVLSSLCLLSEALTIGTIDPILARDLRKHCGNSDSGPTSLTTTRFVTQGRMSNPMFNMAQVTIGFNTSLIFQLGFS
jgi:hypothetical protein